MAKLAGQNVFRISAGSPGLASFGPRKQLAPQLVAILG